MTRLKPITDHLHAVHHVLGKIGLEVGGQRLAEQIYRVWQHNSGTLFLAGNGGSFANALHIANDLQKYPLVGHGAGAAGHRGLKTQVLGANASLMTALANDLGYESALATELWDCAGSGDMLLVLSCSGSSLNILAAMQAARAIGIYVAVLTGRLPPKVPHDLNVQVPHDDPRVIEDIHLIIGHAVAGYLRARHAEPPPF